MKLCVYGYVPDEKTLALLEKTGKTFEELGFQVKADHVFAGVILEVFDEDSLIYFDEPPMVSDVQRTEVTAKMALLAENLGLGHVTPVHCFLG